MTFRVSFFRFHLTNSIYGLYYSHYAELLQQHGHHLWR
jgi:hypothetical protein